MEYREYPPAPALAPFVDRLWTLLGGQPSPGEVQPILPDGRPELVIHFGDPFERVSVSGSIPSAPRRSSPVRSISSRGGRARAARGRRHRQPRG